MASDKIGLIFCLLNAWLSDHDWLCTCLKQGVAQFRVKTADMQKLLGTACQHVETWSEW